MKLYSIFAHVREQFEKKVKENFEVTNWMTNNCNTHILSDISKSQDNETIRFG